MSKKLMSTGRDAVGYHYNPSENRFQPPASAAEAAESEAAELEAALEAKESEAAEIEAQKQMFTGIVKNAMREVIREENAPGIVKDAMREAIREENAQPKLVEGAQRGNSEYKGAGLGNVEESMKDRAKITDDVATKSFNRLYETIGIDTADSASEGGENKEEEDNDNEESLREGVVRRARERAQQRRINRDSSSYHSATSPPFPHTEPRAVINNNDDLKSTSRVVNDQHMDGAQGIRSRSQPMYTDLTCDGVQGFVCAEKLIEEALIDVAKDYKEAAKLSTEIVDRRENEPQVETQETQKKRIRQQEDKDEATSISGLQEDYDALLVAKRIINKWRTSQIMNPQAPWQTQRALPPWQTQGAPPNGDQRPWHPVHNPGQMPGVPPQMYEVGGHLQLYILGGMPYVQYVQSLRLG